MLKTFLIIKVFCFYTFLKLPILFIQSITLFHNSINKMFDGMVLLISLIVIGITTRNFWRVVNLNGALGTLGGLF